MRKTYTFNLVVMLFSLFIYTNYLLAKQQSLRDMLSGNNCPASCYLGIIPSVTTQAELEQLLNQNNIQAVPSPIGPSGKLLIYSFAIDDPNGFIRNNGDSVYIDVTANHVDQITLLLTNVTVQDILSLYGSPDIVKGIRSNLIIYKSQGLVFATSPEDPNLVSAAFLQEVVEGRSRLSNFLDVEACTSFSVNCSIPTATPSPILSLTPTYTPAPNICSPVERCWLTRQTGSDLSGGG